MACRGRDFTHARRAPLSPSRRCLRLGRPGRCVRAGGARKKRAPMTRVSTISTPPPFYTRKNVSAATTNTHTRTHARTLHLALFLSLSLSLCHAGRISGEAGAPQDTNTKRSRRVCPPGSKGGALVAGAVAWDAGAVCALPGAAAVPASRVAADRAPGEGGGEAVAVAGSGGEAKEGRGRAREKMCAAPHSRPATAAAPTTPPTPPTTAPSSVMKLHPMSQPTFRRAQDAAGDRNGKRAAPAPGAPCSSEDCGSPPGSPPASSNATESARAAVVLPWPPGGCARRRAGEGERVFIV